MDPTKPVDGAVQAAEGNGTRDDVALSVRGLVKTFEVGGGWLGGEKGEVSAVADVSFDIGFGRTLGLVGSPGAASPPRPAASCG